MASNLKINIDILLRGAEQISKLAKSLRELQGPALAVSKGIEAAQRAQVRSSKAVTKAADDQIKTQERLEASMLRRAQVVSSLQKTDSNYIGAIKTLESVLAKTELNTNARIKTEEQLIKTKNAFANSLIRTQKEAIAESKARENAGRSIANQAGLAVSQTTRYAQALARLRVAEGNAAEGKRILEQALTKVNASSREGIRLQTQLTRLNNLKTTTTASPEASILRHAQAVARLQFAQGNAATAANTLQNALKGVNQQTTAAVRAQTQLVNIQNQFANSPLIGAVRGVAQALGSAVPGVGVFGTQLGAATNAAGGFQIALTALAGAGTSAVIVIGGIAAALLSLVGAFFAAKAASEGLFEIAKAGIEFNAQIELAEVGVAAIITALGKLTLDGKTLQGIDKFNAGLTLSKDLIGKLVDDAARLGLPLAELVEGFQVALAPLTRAGVELEKARQTTVNLALAMRAAGIPARELAQETRAILAGTIGRQDRLNKILQITSEELDLAKAQGKTFDLFQKKLEAFAIAGEIAGTTLTVAIERARVKFKQFASDITERTLFEPIRNTLNEFLGGKINISGIKNAIEDLFSLLGSKIKPIVEFLAQKIQDLSRFLADNRKVVQDVATAALSIAENLLLIPIDLFSVLIPDAETLKRTITAIAEILKDLAKDIEQDRIDIAKITGAVQGLFFLILAGLKVISLGINLVIQQILVGIPGIGFALSALIDNDIRRLQNELEDLRIELGQVFDEAKRLEQARLASQATETPLAKRIRESARIRKEFAKPVFTPAPDLRDRTGRGGARSTENTFIDLLREREQLLQASFRVEQAIRNQSIDAAKDTEDAKTADMERALANRSLSIADFEAERQRLAQNTSNLIVDALRAELAFAERQKVDVAEIDKKRIAVEKSTVKKEALSLDAKQNQLEIDAKILDIQTKIASTTAQRTIADTAAFFKSREEFRQLRDDVRLAEVELQRLTGDEFGAATTEIVSRFRDLLKRVILEFGEASEQALAIIQLINKLTQDAAVRDIQVDVGTFETRLRTAQLSLQNLVEQGAISEAQARTQVLVVERQIKKELQSRLSIQLAIAKASLQEGPAKRSLIANLELQIAQTQNLGIDKIFGEIRKGLTQDLVSGVNQWLNSTMVGLEDLRNLALSVIQGLRNAINRVISDFIQKRIIDPLVSVFLDKIFGIKSIDPNVLANTVATNANTVAINANTFALIALTGAITAMNVAQVAGGISDALPEFGNGQESVAAATPQIEKSIKDFGKDIGNFFEKTFRDLGSTLSKIGKTIFGAVKSVFSTIIGALGFEEGGYTGPGRTDKAVGVVHAGEYVTPAHAVRKYGVGLFEALRQHAINPSALMSYLGNLANFRSPARSGFFQTGGLAGSVQEAGAIATGKGQTSLRVINVLDPSVVGEFLDSAAGETVILNRMSRAPSRFRAALGIA